MRKFGVFGWLIGLSAVLLGQQADIYEEKVTSAANICTTISNLGLIGNAFGGSFNVLGYPSCEYPCGSGVEHIFEGGLWVGGLINGTEAVSTGASDSPTGYSTGRAGFEFSAKMPLSERSSLTSSPFYNPQAISHQDFFSTFTDTATSLFTGSNSIPISEHLTPLGLKIDFQSYNWNYSFANFFVILNFRINNISNTPVDSVYLGYWVDGVIRNVNITPPGGTAFFNKSGNGYIDSLLMGYEFDALGDIGYTDSYVGTKLLGVEKNGSCPSGVKPHYNTWQFQNSADPILFYPTTDKQRYGKLKSGLSDLPAAQWDQIQNQIKGAGNRSNLLSIGPVDRLNPGDYVDIAFAIVVARRVFDGNPASANTPEQRVNLIKNAQWAQTAYYGEDANRNCTLDPGEDKNGDGLITRFVLPSPPAIPQTKIIAKDKSIDVYWGENAEYSIDPISNKKDFEGYRLYKTAIGFDVQGTTDIFNSLKLVGEWDKKGNALGYETGFESVRLAQPVTFDGDTTQYFYKYTFENIVNGWQHIVSLTAFDEGDAVNNLESLESASLANLSHVFAGKPANSDIKTAEPFVYPNPYYAGAAWEGISSFEEDRKLVFANLPKHAEISVYTVAGDLVDAFEHNAETYNGGDTRWFSTYSNPDKATFSGGEHAWDLLSANTQVVARGLYVFVVRDLDNGKLFRGKFVIIK